MSGSDKPLVWLRGQIKTPPFSEGARTGSAMKKATRQRLEAAGWKVGSTADFLGLSREEESLIDMKLALANKLKTRRHERNWTQLEIAKRIGSSRSRIAKMESADKSVSLDLPVRSLLSLGATRQEIADAMGAPVTKRTRNRCSARKRVMAG